MCVYTGRIKFHVWKQEISAQYGCESFPSLSVNQNCFNKFAVLSAELTLGWLHSDSKTPISGLVFKLWLDLFIFCLGWHCQSKCWRWSQSRCCRYQNSFGITKFLVLDAWTLYNGGCGSFHHRTAWAHGRRSTLVTSVNSNRNHVPVFLW